MKLIRGMRLNDSKRDKEYDPRYMYKYVTYHLTVYGLEVSRVDKGTGTYNIRYGMLVPIPNK